MVGEELYFVVVVGVIEYDFGSLEFVVVMY